MHLKDRGYYRLRDGSVVEIGRSVLNGVYPRDTHMCIRTILDASRHHPIQRSFDICTWQYDGRFYACPSHLDITEEVSEEEIAMCLLGTQK